MDFKKLEKIAKGLTKFSRFELTKIKGQAEKGIGPLSRLSRFEVAQVVALREKLSN